MRVDRVERVTDRFASCGEQHHYFDFTGIESRICVLQGIWITHGEINRRDFGETFAKRDSRVKERSFVFESEVFERDGILIEYSIISAPLVGSVSRVGNTQKNREITFYPLLIIFDLFLTKN